MKLMLLSCFLSVLLIGNASCNNHTASDQETSGNDTMSKGPDIRTETVSFNDDTLSLNGFVAYDANKEGRRPVVLVVPEWWGLNDYAEARAKQLAELGYLAMAVDMYGHGVVAQNPEEAQKLAGPFYKDPQMGMRRLEAALAKAKTYEEADTTRLAAIGYCFGGAQALNAAKMGMPFNGVVSFHGNLGGVPPMKGMKAQVLVCHGEADKFIPPADIANFKKQMDSVGARYTFKSYPNATHAFTNPASTETGKKFNLPIEYNPAADTASWNDMKAFFGSVLQ